MPPAGRCDCARSDRGWEVAGGYASRDDHVRRLPPDGAGTLLGNLAQFCHAYFHCSPTPELASHPHETCLRRAVDPAGRKCETKGVVVVAALRDPRGDVTFLSRYSNCPMREHAEEFLLSDEALFDAIDALAPLPDPENPSDGPSPPPGSRGVLTLYQRLQPCHRSADNRGRWSCSEALRDRLWRRALKPRGVRLDVAVSYTYRAHWDLTAMCARDAARYGPAIEAAREGLRVFARAAREDAEVTGSNPGPRAVNPTPPVRLRALASEDWRFLASLCDRDAREHLEAALGNGAWDGGGGEKITREAAEHRRAMDAFVAARVEEYSVDATRKGETEQRRSAAESASVSEGSPPRTFAEKMRMKRAAAAAAAKAKAHR